MRGSMDNLCRKKAQHTKRMTEWLLRYATGEQNRANQARP